jgi:two-component SAPR family response regulator
MKYQCLIVDDEPVAQQILEKYINQIEALHLVAKCSNAFEAMNILHQEKVDILFLDIKMPLLSGIEMLKTIQNQSKVILTTAFSEFAVESYEYALLITYLNPFLLNVF